MKNITNKLKCVSFIMFAIYIHKPDDQIMLQEIIKCHYNSHRRFSENLIFL